MKKILTILVLLLLLTNASSASLFSNVFYFACTGNGTKFVEENKRVYWNGVRYVGLDKEKIYFFWASVGNGKKKFLREEKLGEDGSKNDLVTGYFVYGANNQIVKFEVKKHNNSSIGLNVIPNENSEMKGRFTCKKTSKGKIK